MRAKHLPRALHLPDEVVGSLPRERGTQLDLLASLVKGGQTAGGLLEPGVQRRKLLLRDQARVVESALAAQRVALQLLGLLQQPADPNQLLPQLFFLLRFSLQRLGRRCQGPGRLGRRRAGPVDPAENALALGDASRSL